MTRYLPFLLYLLLIAMYEVIWRELTAFYFIAMNLAAMIVVIVAIYKSEIVAAWFGFFAGLVLSAGRPETMGWHALVLSVLAVGVFHVRERLNLDSIYSKLLLITGTVFVHNVFSVIVNDTPGFLYMLWAYCLPSAAYTTIVAWLFFLFKERKITVQKIKSVF